MVKKYYVTGNTAQGQIDLINSNVKGMKKVIKLEHPSYRRNSFIMEEIIKAYEKKTAVEILKSPISSLYLEGIILREQQVAIIGNRDFTVPSAYAHFAEGLRIHDKIEKIFIQEMDFEKADKTAEELIEKLLKNVPKQDRQPTIFRRFFGTNTMDGVVNEVPHLISGLDEVYHIKGRSGTGKSTFMKKVAAALKGHGFDLEIYHCSFDSNSIDMVLAPDLKICLFDSTDPHRFQPEDKSREKIIDLYDIAVTPGTDEKYFDEIAALTSEYKSSMEKGLQEIKKQAEKVVESDRKLTYSEAELESALKKVLTEIKNKT